MPSLKTVFTFVRERMTRPNFAHLAFLGGIGVLSYGAGQLGAALGVTGLGAIFGGLALIAYGYLLGAE